MNALRGNHRSGWTLVELLCVISVLGVIMGVITTFLNTTRQLRTEMRDRFEMQNTVGRLADQFRTDVRLSTEATISSGELTLSSPTASIVFRSDDAGITREATRTPTANTESATETTTRDGFWLTGQKADWNRQNQLVSLSLQSATHAPIVIQANLGGDLNKDILAATTVRKVK